MPRDASSHARMKFKRSTTRMFKVQNVKCGVHKKRVKKGKKGSSRRREKFCEHLSSNAHHTVDEALEYNRVTTVAS